MLMALQAIHQTIKKSIHYLHVHARVTLLIDLPACLTSPDGRGSQALLPVYAPDL